MSRRINVRGIIFRDGKLFAVRHNWRDGQGKEFWCTPGGGLDEGESLIDGVTREMIEETGVRPVVGRLLWVYQIPKPPEAPYPESEILEFFFHIENASDYEHIDLSATTHGAQELKETAFIDPSTVNFKPRSISALDLEMLTTKNSPVVVTDELSES